MFGENTRLRTKLLKHCSILIDTIGQFISRQYIRQLKLCDLRTDNLMLPSFCFCVVTDEQLFRLWSDICDLLGYNTFLCLTHLGVLAQTATVLKYATAICFVCNKIP